MPSFVPCQQMFYLVSTELLCITKSSCHILVKTNNSCLKFLNKQGWNDTILIKCDMPKNKINDGQLQEET